MREMKVLTSEYRGKMRVLTIPQWAAILKLPTKKIYNRKTMGLSDQEAIDGRHVRKKIKAETKKEEIARMYRIFNFNLDDVSTRRQRDGV